MEKSKNVFIKIDEFIFQKLDFLKTEGSLHKINELISGFDEPEQKIVAQVMTFTLIMIPYLFVIFFWWGNHKMRVNLDVKSQIIEQISTLNGNKDTKAVLSSTYLAQSAIQSTEELSGKIKSLLAANNIEQSKVQVVNFTQISTTSTIAKIEATLNFQSFGTQDFSNFMRVLMDQEKFKIVRINLEKNKTTNLLNGNISLMHLGRSSAF